MKLTIDKISQILKVPTSTIEEALAELGINPDKNELLSEKDIKKLRPVLFRCYQSSIIPSSEEPFDSLSNSSEDTPTECFDSFLEELVANHIIMLDTCSIMHEGCSKFIESLCPILKKYNKKIVIPNKVIEELKKHYNCWNDSTKLVLAEKGLQLCKKLKHENCLSIRGGQYDNFADNVFFVHFSNLRFKYNMVLVTQDYKLSQDILQLNNMQTGGGKPVKVFKLSGKGSLIEI